MKVSNVNPTTHWDPFRVLEDPPGHTFLPEVPLGPPVKITAIRS